MYHQSIKAKFTLEDFIASHKQILSEKEGKLKFLKRALADLNLNHHSIPLPLSIFNHTSKELDDPSDEETPDDPDQVKLTKAPTPDYDSSCYFLSKLGEHEELRRKYAEERRKEYNEYLKEAKFATSRIKLLERKAEAARMSSPLRSYAELLDEKRENEKAYRSMNDHHIITEGTSYEPDFFGYQAKRHRDSGFDILNWQSKYPANDVEPLVPKNRLLATHSSRIKACQYKEELMKQIEDKHRREAERLRREKEEELLIEKRLNEQRLRLLKEYEDEQRQQKIKADSLARKQEIIKEMISGKKNIERSGDTERHEVIQANQVKPDRKPVSPIKPKLPRSPSYLHVRHPKSPGNRKSRLSLESRLVQEEMTVMTSPPSTRTSVRPGKALQSPVKNRLGGDEILASEPAKYQPPDPVQLEKVDLHAQIESNKNAESKGDRVLTRLSEVRKKMQEDHQRMLQHLKDQL